MARIGRFAILVAAGILAASATPAWSATAAIAIGTEHACALSTSGAVQCWGLNSNGQLGDGTTANRRTPVPVAGLDNGVQAIAASDAHTCAVTAAGAVLCWGENSQGELGDGTSVDSLMPVAVSGLTTGVRAITAGFQHTCAITSAGAVQCWGSNISGELGDGTSAPRFTPVASTGLTSGVQAVAAGYNHTCALSTAGAVQCWGANGSGQLGDGTTTNHRIAAPATGLGSGVRAIAGGYRHACALNVTDGASCWGRNDYGQLGDGTTTQRLTATAVTGLGTGVLAIANGYLHSCAVSNAGAVQCWGSNNSGQLGSPTGLTQLTAAPVTGLGSGVTAISAGTYFSCALTGAGGVRCWGDNQFGQLGDGTTTSRPAPVAVQFPPDTAPTLSYTPPPGTQIELPGGALNVTVESDISIQAIGGEGVGEVQVACSVGAPFTLPDEDTFTFGVGGVSTTFAVGCTLGAAEQNGNVTCVETDSTGGAPRVRDWPLYCPVGSSARIAAASELANRGGSVAIGVSVIGDGLVHSAVGDLVFDKSLLTPTQVAARNGGNCFLRNAPDDDKVRVSVPTGPSPLASQETTYCSVVFVVADDAPIDSIPLALATTTCLDGSNAASTCMTTDGSIAVSAFDTLPRPGNALNMVALAGQPTVSTTIFATNFGGSRIDIDSCTPDPATGFAVAPSGAFFINAMNSRAIAIQCTTPAVGLPPRVSDLNCLVGDTTPSRVVRYRLVCSAAGSAPISGSTLTGDGTAAGDEVGTALATTIDASGNEITVIGAPFAGADDGGRAFVIVRAAGSDLIAAEAKVSGGRETLQPKASHALSATTALGDKFGNAVAINPAGDTIAIGAPFGGSTGDGRVFVFLKPAGGWTTLDTPNMTIEVPAGPPADGVVADEFGAQLAYTENNLLVVGAPRSDVDSASDAGAAFVFAPGSTTASAVVRAPQVETGAQFAGAIAANRGALAIGAPFENAAGNSDQGAVYVMAAPGEPAETVRRLTASAGSSFDKFGSSVAYTGGTLVVGAPADDTEAGTDAGSATVFAGTGGGGFIETMTIEPPGNPGQQGGAAVATNGGVILLGAPFAIVAGRPAQGRVFAYDLPEASGTAASAATIIDNTTGQSGDRFGAYLTTSQRRLVVGAPKDDNELGISGTTVQIDEGRADSFLFDRISRAGFE